MIEQSIYSHFSTSAALTALISDRIYPMMMPQDPVLPSVTYQRISNMPVNALSGACGLDKPIIQIDCWSTTYAGVKALGDTVRKALAAGPYFSLQLSDEDIYEPGTEIYRVSMDFSCWFKST